MRHVYSFLLTLALLLVSVGMKAQSGTIYLNESFEGCSGGAGSIPTGWNNQDYTEGPSTTTFLDSYLWYVGTNASDAHSGSRYAQLYAHASFINAARLKTPAITLSSMKDEQVSFWMKSSIANGDFSIYVSLDGGATYVQTPLAQHVTPTTTYTRYQYSLSAYKGQTVTLVFEGGCLPSNYFYYYIDDIVVRDVITCQNPTDIFVNNLTANSATLIWDTDPQSGVYPDNFSLILRDGSGNVVYNDTVNGSVTTKQFTGLQSNTTYTASIIGNCQIRSSAGYSDTISLQFTTLPPALNPPLVENFDSFTAFPTGYYIKNATINTSQTYSYGFTGNSVQLTTTAMDNAYIIFPLMNIAADNFEMDFVARRMSPATTSVKTINFKAGYITDPSDIDGSFVPVVFDSIAGDASWRSFRFNSASVLSTTSPVMVCILLDAAYATSIFIDNVDIHVRPTCTRPEHLSYSNLQSDRLTLSWNLSNASLFVVKATPASGPVVTANATQSPYVLTGLTPNTEYQITVQGVCSTTDSSEISTPMSVKTYCATSTTPIFFEGAESTTGSALPDCWRTGYLINNGTTVTAPFITTTTQKIGSRGFCMPTRAIGTTSYLVSQPHNFDVSGKYTFRYQVYRYAGSYSQNEGFKVYVTPIPGSLQGAVEIIPFIDVSAERDPMTQRVGWNEYEGAINYQGVGYIMIVGTCMNAYENYIDNLEILLTPSCPKVTDITPGTPTTNTFSISWAAGDTATQWIVDYQVKQGATVVQSSSAVTATNSYTITGLNPGNSYIILGNVRAICAVGDTAEATSFNTTCITTCETVTQFPHFEGAETTVDANLPTCWTTDFIDRHGSTSTMPFTTLATAHTGTRGFNLRNAGDSVISYLASPRFYFDAPNKYELSLWVERKVYGTTPKPNEGIQIWISDNPGDTINAVKLDHIRREPSLAPVVAEAGWYKYTYTIPVQGNKYLLIVGISEYGTNTCFDDIYIREIPACDVLEGNTDISEITATSAKVSIADITAITGWSYAYGVAGTSVSEMTPVDTSGNFVVINGLTPLTLYDLYVRRDCGVSGYGAWAAVKSFKTAAVSATIPYICNFETAAENNQWTIVEGASATNKFVIGTVASAVYQGAQSIYVSKDNGLTNEYAHNSTRTYAYRPINFESKAYQIEFYWRCPGGDAPLGLLSSITDYGKVMILPVSTVLLAGEEGTSITSSNPSGGFPANEISFNPQPDNCIKLAGDDWHFESYLVNMTGAAGDYNFVLAWNNNGSSGTVAGPLAVDNISIREVTCMPPTEIITSSLTDTSFTLNVSQTGATQWEFIVDTLPYSKNAVPADPFRRVISTTGAETFTGLASNTEYYCSVRTICTAGDTSSWIAPVAIRTFCSAGNIPYFEGFENANSTFCWTMVPNATQDAAITRVTNYHNTGAASLQVVKTTLISPEFAVDSLTHYMLSGYAYTTVDSVAIEVGVMVDPNDISTYEGVSTIVIPTKNTWFPFSAYFAALVNPQFAQFKNAKHIAIACNNNTLYFDDILVDVAPTCPGPTQVSITNVGGHSFDISFTDNANASQWVVYTNGMPNVITTNPATITDLASSTDYTVTMAAICSSTDTSSTVVCGSIRTLCDKTATPWYCGFEASEGYTGGTSYTAATTGNFGAGCWNIFNIKAGGKTTPYAYVSTSTSYLHTGKQGVYTTTSTAAVKMLYMMMPDFEDPSNMLNVKVWYKNGGTTATYATLKFGYFTDPTTDTSFVEVYSFPKYSTWTEGMVLTNDTSYHIPANVRLGFKMDRGTSAGNGLYLDDIAVKLIRSCSDPEFPTASDFTSSSAKITITDTCNAHTAWEYVCGPVGFNPNTATPVSVSSKTFTVNGLADDTEYDVYVRAVCGVNDVSNYISTTFRTLCLPFVVTETNPYYEDFNSYGYNQFLHNGTCFNLSPVPTSESYQAKTYPTAQPSATARTKNYYGHSEDINDRCLYWYIYKTILNNANVLRQFHLEGGRLYEVSAWVRNGTTTTQFTNVSAIFGSTTTVFDTLSMVTVAGSAAPKITVEGSTVNDYSQLYREIKGYFTPDSTGDYYVGFNAKSKYNADTYLYLDDWKLRAFAGCIPAIPAVQGVSTSTATITVPDTSFHHFEYVLNDTTLVPTSVSNDTFVVENLRHSTVYKLYLRKYCDATTHSEWIPVEFTTSCSAVDEFPYTEGFEGEFPPVCWSQFYYGTTTSYIWNSSTSAAHVHTGKQGAYIPTSSANGKAALVTGEFNLNSPTGYYLRVWVYRASATSYNYKFDEALHIGYLNVPITAENIGSVRELGEIHPSVANRPTEPTTAAGYFLFEYEIPYSVTGSTWFSFDYQSENGNGIAIDDITIEPIPSCVPPKTAPVVASTTMNTATVTVDMQRKPQAEIVWVKNVRPDSIAGSAVTSTGKVVATDLDASTGYAFKYRYVCAAGDTSEWSALAVGTTTETDCFAPQNLRVVGLVNGHNATITWGKAPDAVNYQYELKQGDVVVDSAVSLNDTVVYDSLTVNTAYTFRVRAFCATDTTAWQTLSIQTTCETFSLPFVCDFENPTQNTKWQFRKISTTGSNEYVIGSSTSKAGSNSLYVSDDYTTYHYNPTNISVCDAEAYLEILHPGKYQVSFDWTCVGERASNTNYDFGRVLFAPANVTITGTNSASFRYGFAAGVVPIDGFLPLINNSSWNRHSEIIEVKTSGMYKIAVTWVNDRADGSAVPLAIDNIRFEEVTCMPVSDVKIITNNATNAKALVYRNNEGSPFEYGLSAIDSEDSITWTMATSDTLSLAMLTPGTEYYLFVREVCSETEKSASERVVFTTPSHSTPVPFNATFEVNDATLQHWTYTRGNALNYFIVGSAVCSAGNRSLYITNDSISYAYTQDIYQQGINTCWSYAYIPIEFPAGKFDISYKWQCAGESANDWGRIMLAPSYIVPTDNVQLAGMQSSYPNPEVIPLDAQFTRLNNSNGWVDGVTQLDLQNGNTYNLIIGWHNDANSGNNPPLAIDNIYIREHTCPIIDVNNVDVDSVSTDLIRLNIGGIEGNDIIYHVSSNPSFTDTITSGQTNDTVITVNGLTPSTWYYAHLWLYCGEGDTSAMTTVSVRTDCQVLTDFPYTDGFESYVASSSSRSELDNNCWTVTAPTTSTAAYYYIVNSASAAHSGNKALYIYNYSIAGIHTFAMPIVDTLADQQISMWYRNSSSTSTALLEVGYLTNPEDASTFVLLGTAPVSTTYAEFVVDYPSTVPAGARPAFRANGENSLTVDDVRLNRLSYSPVYNDTICFNSSYSGHGFSCPVGSLAPGDTVMTRMVRSTVTNVDDSVITAHVFVRSEIFVSENDTVCQGVPYVTGLWNIPSPESRLYFSTFTSSTGCDSTVYLTLYVLPSTTVLYDTVCQGNPYIFDGQNLTQSGVYTKYGTNYLGCPDTTILNLLVVDSTFVTNAQVCQGNTYFWEGQQYSQSGTYRVTSVGQYGCPLTKILNLTVNQSVYTIDTTFCHGGQVQVVDTVITTVGSYTLHRFNATTGCDITYNITVTEDSILTGYDFDESCEGKPYYGFGLAGEIITADTSFTFNTRTADGKCDSAVVVAIEFIPTVTGEVEEITIPKDSAYTWHDRSYNVSGTYRDTVPSLVTGCDSICILHLIVDEGSAVDNLEMLNISLVPNPVNAGQTSFIYGNFTSVKNVEVLNSFGQVIDSFVPAGYPIEIEGINASGIYYVRVTTEDDKVAVQKLIVK